MNFLSKFQSFFTEEEKESEIYRIMCSIGIDAEKTLIESVNKDIRASTELMAFSDDKIRSWLSFFLVQIPNMRSASGIGEIRIIEASSLVYIPSGSKLISRSGKVFEQTNDLS